MKWQMNKHDFTVFCLSDVHGHGQLKCERLMVVGSLKDVDVRDCTRGALYPNVSLMLCCVAVLT